MRLLKTYFLFLSTFLFASAFSQHGYHINITLKPYKNSQIYLAYYYGKLKAVADSITLDDKSTGVFARKEKLPGGIYFIVSPKKEIVFELLIDSQQNFSIAADTTDVMNNITFTGSPENKLFQSYTAFASKDGKIINDLQKEFSTAKTKTDSTQIIDKIKKLNQEMQDYRDDFQKKYPTSLLATVFAAMKDPVVPPAKTTGRQIRYKFCLSLL